MRKRNVLFGQDPYEAWGKCLDDGMIVFIRPIGSKLFRVCLPKECSKEVKDFLRSESVFSRAVYNPSGEYFSPMFYMKIEDMTVLISIGEVLQELGHVEHLFIEPDDKVWGMHNVQANINAN
jgi:hypothetical protein